MGKSKDHNWSNIGQTLVIGEDTLYDCLYCLSYMGCIPHPAKTASSFRLHWVEPRCWPLATWRWWVRSGRPSNIWWSSCELRCRLGPNKWPKCGHLVHFFFKGVNSGTLGVWEIKVGLKMLSIQRMVSCTRKLQRFNKKPQTCSGPAAATFPCRKSQAFCRNSIDTSWLDGMIRERTVKVKYETLGMKWGKA